MKIFLICSKAFYGKLKEIKEILENNGHEITLPNCYDCPQTEAKYRGTDEHAKWKASMIKHSEEVIRSVDAVLVVNYDKNGQKNYIGGATFLEIYDAFRLNKKIFFMNDLPEGMLKDELIGFNGVVINEDLSRVK
jgi:diphthamide synthase subunit DPH2